MKAGAFVRGLLPAGLERRAASAYRSCFVDLGAIARHLERELPPDARLVDIGGGDGELVNLLLRRRKDVTVSMIDIAPSVGKYIDEDIGKRVRSFPSTSVLQHLHDFEGHYDAALLVDVVHHVPEAARNELLRGVSRLLKNGLIFVKDIEPGSFIASAARWTDVYISGDPGVRQIASRDLGRLVQEALGRCAMREVGLLEEDRPNYLLRFDFPT